MLRAVVAGCFILMSSVTWAEDSAWPADKRLRVDAQIGACGAGQTDACFEAADELAQSSERKRRGYTPASLRERGMTVLDERCTSGTADACFDLGKRMATRRNVAVANAKVLRGCELGNGDACTYVAARERKASRVLELLERGCELGSAGGCERLAQKLEKRDPTRAAKLHAKACTGGDTSGCIRSGELRRAAGNAAGAFEHYQRGCELALEDLDARDPATRAPIVACDAAGLLAPDKGRAWGLFEKGCDAGHAPACTHLGERIALGEGGQRHWGNGLALVRETCAKTGDKTCKAARELEKRRPSWQCSDLAECILHCEENLWPACRRLVELDPDGEHRVRGSHKEHLAAACTAGDATACTMQGDAAGSFAIARKDYKRACKLGDAQACRYVRFGRAIDGTRADIAALRRACDTDVKECSLYGLAIARTQRKEAIRIWRRACDAKVGVACRYLGHTYDDDSIHPDAMHEVVLRRTLQYGGGTCDCDLSAHKSPSQAEVDAANRKNDEAQRLWRLGCTAGDARSCQNTLGPDRTERPPVTPVAVPAWL